MHALPNIEIASKEGRQLSPEFFERLLAFWKHVSNEPYTLSFTWKHIYDLYGVAFIEALNSGSADRLEEMLGDMYSSGVLYGLDTNPHFTQWNDYCIRCASSLRIIPEFNPEQPNDLMLDPEVLISQMEEIIGCEIDHPGGGNISGATVGDRFIPIKLLEAVTTFQVCRRIYLLNSPVVYELGAGMGWLAFMFYRALPDITAYHINDLPVASIIQGYFLALALGEDAISFRNESVLSSKIRIHGPRLPRLNPLEIGIAINQNSLPEMKPSEQKRYLQHIEQSMSHDGVFVSINHESSAGEQSRVIDAVRQHTHLTLKNASPWWFRQGYIQEIFVKNGN